MCLALPAQIVTVEPTRETAIVSLAGVKKEISVTLVDDVAPGDFVLVHVGFALHKLSPEEAERTLRLIREAGLDEEIEEVMP